MSTTHVFGDDIARIFGFVPHRFRLRFRKDDGGREAAGYQGEAGDCVVRSIAIAAERPYQEVYDAINDLARRERLRKRRRSSSRNGVFKKTYHQYVLGLGFRWVPCMGIGTGCVVHLRNDELPDGRLIVAVSRHMTAVVDGVIHDTWNCDRGGKRCVYGYYALDRAEEVPREQREPQ